MTILKFTQKQPDTPFIKDILNDGYHIFSLKNAKKPDYYPNEFPDYPGVSIKDLKPDDLIIIRVFFRVDSGGKDVRADGGYVDLKVEHVLPDGVVAVILTKLPEDFPLQTGETIDVLEEEILYKTDEQEQLKWN